MSRINNLQFVWVALVFWIVSYVGATLTINQIKGPDSIEIGSAEDLILDCDFDATGEDDVVLKWFFNDLNDVIYQWIAQDNHAYAMGSLKEFIDPSYKVSDNPNSMFRALKFKEITPELSGNYSCKVDTDDEVKWLTKQVIVYSPASSFQIYLIGGDDEFQGDEVVLCDVTNVFPKPDFDLLLGGENGTEELPDMFNPSREEVSNEDGSFNMSIRLPFNSSHLDQGTTKFVCELSISGTNYTESKSVEYFVDSGISRPGISLLLAIHLLALSLLLVT